MTLIPSSKAPTPPAHVAATAVSKAASLQHIMTRTTRGVPLTVRGRNTSLSLLNFLPENVSLAQRQQSCIHNRAQPLVTSLSHPGLASLLCVVRRQPLRRYPTRIIPISSLLHYCYFPGFESHAIRFPPLSFFLHPFLYSSVSRISFMSIAKVQVAK